MHGIRYGRVQFTLLLYFYYHHYYFTSFRSFLCIFIRITYFFAFVFGFLVAFSFRSLPLTVTFFFLIKLMHNRIYQCEANWIEIGNMITLQTYDIYSVVLRSSNRPVSNFQLNETFIEFSCLHSVSFIFMNSKLISLRWPQSQELIG